MKIFFQGQKNVLKD